MKLKSLFFGDLSKTLQKLQIHVNINTTDREYNPLKDKEETQSSSNKQFDEERRHFLLEVTVYFLMMIICEGGIQLTSVFMNLY